MAFFRLSVLWLAILLSFGSPTTIIPRSETQVIVSTTDEFQRAVGDNVTISFANDIDLSKTIQIDAVTGLIIEGNNFELNGQNKLSLMYIGGTSYIKIKNLIMIHGNTTLSTGGGAFYAEDGIILLYKCQIIKCSAWGSYPFGGGIMSDFASIYLYHSLVHKCQSDIGGGLSTLFGSYYIYNSTIINNDGGFGGGLCLFLGGDDSELIIKNSYFSNNNAQAIGGSLYISSIQNTYIYNTIFINNTSYEDGGAIIMTDSNVKIHQCLFISNLAYQSGGAINAVSSDVLIEDSDSNSDSQLLMNQKKKKKKMIRVRMKMKLMMELMKLMMMIMMVLLLELFHR
mmetsp:Transcript_20864/g.27128  ORF Transcript_20864/g.27128 Transcript_20864/m.27128 type:complete len:341 (+) Transcript_20864:3-1025(+)